MMWKLFLVLGSFIGVALMPSMASAQSNPCGMILGGPAIFCDTFDTPNPGVPSRTGGLDPNVWGVSRAFGGLVNFGQGLFNAWPATALIGCNGTTTVLPPNDVMICNGQLREATNDNASGQFEQGGISVLAIYPKQPFDFAGRTGTVSFDVSNDSHGVHAAWPEFWMSDLPVPVPFNHNDSWVSLPQNGFGIRFSATVGANNQGGCPNNNNVNKPRWTVDSAAVSRNYVLDDTSGFGTRTAMNVTQFDCVIAPPDNSGIMNHVEIRVSQNQIDVWATDAGVVATPATLRKIASINNANLTLTRGLVWLQDVHYNADKGDPSRPSQRQHTFVWDNLAFDGPFTYRDFSYDALDANVPVNNFAPNLANNLGKFAWPQASSWDVLNIPANPNPAAVRVLFNFFHQDAGPMTLNVTVNGHAHSAPWPYPDTAGNNWRTFALSIPVTDLIAGTNAVQIGAPGQAIVVSNVNIVLVNVPGGVPVLPGSNNAYPTSTADITPPTMPANLQAAATSPYAITLTWMASTDNVGVTGYKVFRNGAQINTAPGASYSDSGLTPATQYNYAVAAYDAAGNTSAQSAAASATTQAPTPVCHMGVIKPDGSIVPGAVVQCP